MTYWINGEYREETQAINIADRGFLLGDGLFETLLLVRGVPVFLKRHLQRLRASAAALKIEIPFSDKEIGAGLKTLAVKNGANSAQASARITLTRGVSARGLAVSKAAQPTLLVTVAPYEPPTEPASLVVSRIIRAENSLSAAHKTLNYVDNVMARNEASNAGADDAVMLNSAGRVACVSAANIFLITKEGAVITPSLKEGALPGVVRSVLFGLAGEFDAPVKERPVELSELHDSQLFITNSLTGLRPAFIMGAAPSRHPAVEIMQRLQSCYSGAVKNDLDGE